jgi:hypothetical protein
MIAAKHDSAPVYSDRDKRTIGKYLERYSEPESRWQASQFEKLPADGWDYVVTIPACGEDEYLPGALDSINKCQAARNNDKVLCIVMLNGNQAREEEFKSSNQRMRNWFNDNCMPVTGSLNPDDVCPQSLVRWRNIDILIIDRSQQPWLIPYDQGVGLVRKIAADLALFLISVGWVKSPWIHATDADARVPDDYFLRTNQQSGNSTELSSKACFIYPYQHIPDPDMEQHEHDRYWPAVRDYELWLRYYVAGLQWAGSSYAYPSIGSLLACDALAYAKTRGFPKRMAGEDFYFQNKLAKVGEIIMLEGLPVKLLTRASTRVPFGTGQGTITIVKLNSNDQVYTVYHPMVFVFLKNFFYAVNNWINDTEKNDIDREAAFIETLEGSLPLQNEASDNYSAWLHDLIDELDVFKNLRAAEQRSVSLPGASRQFDDWFDGFRTLKLIHRLRDELYGSIPLIDALQLAEFMPGPQQKPAKSDKR